MLKDISDPDKPRVQDTVPGQNNSSARNVIRGKRRVSLFKLDISKSLVPTVNLN
ncbi:unnamed protein product [Acanthoscelides obtectus]|uniref:Uncharacterized protein n=1 Tax=Acanthoscelides obtectus TaxID=200917 RepID=A0A9P0PDZ4_ACAOB|nr:unnamed protein product [Acanthoscelides obtectus]CAK1656240.1 hypothetical protein AOBTE_LOCUS19624 [Acanthoscelides obtectus]